MAKEKTKWCNGPGGWKCPKPKDRPKARRLSRRKAKQSLKGEH